MLRPGTLAMTFLLAALAALGPLSTDMYLASLPSMTVAFSAEVGQIQLTLSVYLIGFAVCQLIYGPLSDRFGRRPVLIGGLLLYGLSGLACSFAPNVETLIALRLIQAVGACVGVVGRAVVRDVYGHKGSARAMSHIGTAMALAPVVAPILGSYLTVWFGWHSNFVFMGAYGLVAALAVWGLLGESLAAKDLHAVRPGQLARNFAALFGDRRFLGYTLACCFSYAGLFSFISGSSFVLIDFFRVAPEHYGYFFALAVMGYMIGTLISGRMSRRTTMNSAVLAGSAVCAGAGLTMAGLAWGGTDTITAVMAPMVLYMAGMGIVLPQSTAAAIGPYPHMAGIASSVVGFMQYAVAAVIGLGVGQLHDGTQIPMTTSIGAMGLASLVVILVMVERGHDPVEV